MFDERCGTSISERARYEAFSVQDMLSPAPPRPTRLMRLRQRLQPMVVGWRSLLPPRFPAIAHRVEDVGAPAGNL